MLAAATGAAAGVVAAEWGPAGDCAALMGAQGAAFGLSLARLLLSVVLVFGAAAERCVSGEAEAATTVERAEEAPEEALARRKATRRADGGRRAATVAPDGRLRALLARLVWPPAPAVIGFKLFLKKLLAH